MNKFLLLLFFNLFSLFASNVQADWAMSSNGLAVKTTPVNGVTIKQNPPRFAWSRSPLATAAGYEVYISHSSGKSYTFNVPRNWLLPSETFPSGSFSWRVRAVATGAVWSDQRNFVLAADASEFVVPDDATLIAKIKSKPHPRALPIMTGNEDVWRTALLSKRKTYLTRLENEVKTVSNRAMISDGQIKFVAKSANASAWAASLALIRRNVEIECRQLRSASLLWRVTKNKVYFDEAIKRAQALVSLDPNGSTSYQNQDQATRNIAWSLALALDYLANDLPVTEKNYWLSNIKIRAQDMRNDLTSTQWRLEQLPLDAHGSTNIGYLAAISSLLVGEIPEGEQWFKDSFRTYAQYVSPWGGEEGGFAGGTAYAEYSADFFIQLWDSILNATGVNLYEKPWSKGMVKFFAYFLPPGTPSHLFGDAAETKPTTSLAKAFVSRFADADAAWYVKNLVWDEDALSALAAPIPLPVESIVAGSPVTNSYSFPTIGWVAMHSALSDRSRTSVYFKSSQYGSFNHSHGEQNGFVLVAGGMPLITGSGVYDWYGSPHWDSWYRQTAAHNAITFDGGQGQVTKGETASAMAQGKITRFIPSTNIDFTEGDATLAYGGKLTKANRKLWFIRDKQMLVVRDDLAASIARSFEWNAHAAINAFKQNTVTSFEIQHGDQKACLDFLTPTNGTAKISEGFPVLPQVSNPPKSWHLRFSMNPPSKTGKFIVAIRVGCAGIAPQLSGDKVVIGNVSLDTLQ